MNSNAFPVSTGALVADYRSTDEEFYRILNMGRDKEGQPISLEKLDHGIKDSRKLLREMRKEAVELKFNPSTGRTARYAKSARFSLIELRRGIIWKEIARSYPDGQLTQREKNHTLSETLKRRENGSIESGYEAWDRVKKEEIPKVVEALHGRDACFELIPQLAIPDNWFQVLRSRSLFPRFAPAPAIEEWETEEHESSVFEGLPSIIHFLSYEVFLDLNSPQGTLGSEIVITKDCDGRSDDDPDWVKCYLRAFPYEKVKVGT